MKKMPTEMFFFMQTYFKLRGLATGLHSEFTATSLLCVTKRACILRKSTKLPGKTHGWRPR